MIRARKTGGWLMVSFSSFVYAIIVLSGTIFFRLAWMDKGWWWQSITLGSAVISVFLGLNGLYALIRACCRQRVRFR